MALYTKTKTNFLSDWRVILLIMFVISLALSYWAVRSFLPADISTYRNPLSVIILAPTLLLIASGVGLTSHAVIAVMNAALLALIITYLYKGFTNRNPKRFFDFKHSFKLSGLGSFKDGTNKAFRDLADKVTKDEDSNKPAI